ncbi:MAG: deoxyribodipyrimidine photo-lyase [Fimbriimonadaceae bacterium]|nr:deoxyribodipyrimidine photo-lyase [Fimbriimonadaceae bacterium]
MRVAPTVVWYRQDLRLQDHPALTAAAGAGPVVPVYIWAPQDEGDWAPGAASRWWLHHSLQALGQSLAAAGAPLVWRVGDPLTELRQVAAAVGATRVVYTRRYEPAAREQGRRVASGLAAAGLSVATYPGSLLHEPEAVANRSGDPYTVFTPFWRACGNLPVPAAPVAAPALQAAATAVEGCRLEELGLLPRVAWTDGLARTWEPGEAGAARRLARLATVLQRYDAHRDRPDLEGTSRLSPHLHFGEISPRQVYHLALAADATPDRQRFLAELGWREFAYHLLYHYPHTAAAPLRREFEQFPWQPDPEALQRWQGGQTGYPLLDAALRQLWQTGWMHNRLRMLVASFLVKDLLQPWQVGARWFWDTLVDADLACNTLGWQWAAGCGADAAPYFRIFNPLLQARKFDPAGDFVRAFLPELAQLGPADIQAPWQLDAAVLAAAGVTLGATYPAPLVDHAAARARALAAFAALPR